MVYDLIVFAAGVYFGFRNFELSLGALVEQGLPYNVALVGVLTAAVFFTSELEMRTSSVVSVLMYLFLIFIFGSIAGRLSRRMLRKTEG